MASVRLATMDVVFQTKGYEGVRQYIERIQKKGEQASKSITGMGTAGAISAGRLRTLQNQMIGLSGSLLGVQGRLGALASTLLSFGVGGAVGVVATAGVAAIALAYKKLTEETKKAREEAEKTREAFLKMFAPGIRRAEEIAAAQRQATLALQQYNRWIVIARSDTDEGRKALEKATAAWGDYETALMRAAVAQGKVAATMPPPVAEPAAGLVWNEKRRELAAQAMTPMGVADSTGRPRGLRGVEPVQVDDLPIGDPFSDATERMMALVDNMSATIQQGIAQTLGDAIYNGFAAAFSGEGVAGIFEAFGKTLLAGLGKMLVDMGTALIGFGTLMESLKAAMLANPLFAGGAAIAAGAAMIALGSTLSSIAASGGGVGRGTAQAGAFREPRVAPVEDYTTRQFYWGTGARGLTPSRGMVFNVFGPADPSAQRAIIEAVKKGTARGIR